MKGTRVIVVGGTGFLGRHVCATLAGRGAHVLAMARHTPSGPFPFRFHPMDLSTATAGALVPVLRSERPDAVVNATGSIWGLGAEEMEAMCTVPTRRLVEAMAAVGGHAHLVHLGTVLEYGPLPKGTRTHPDLPSRPSTSHGRAKDAATREVLAACEAGGPGGSVLRVANMVGPGSPTISLLGGVARRLAEAEAQGEKAAVEVAPLRAERDYLDVRDVSDAVVSAIRHRVNGALVDIGRGEAVPVRSLVDTLLEVSGVPARLAERDDRGSTREDWICVDPGPARELLGWHARRSLRTAVQDLWSQVRRDLQK